MTQEEAAARGVKLRESCDSCLTAKVKCGKGRPVCTRCLSNGNECKYSPSARAGRKHRNNGVSKAPPRRRPASIEIPSQSPYPLGLSAGPYTAPFLHAEYSNLNRLENVDVSQPKNVKNICSNTPPLTQDEQQQEPMKIEHTDPHEPTDGSIDPKPQVPTPPLSGNVSCDPLSASSTTSFPELSSTTPSPTSGMGNMMDNDAWMSGNYDGYHVPGSYNLDIGMFNDPMLLPPQTEPDFFDPFFVDRLPQHPTRRAEQPHAGQVPTQSCPEAKPDCEDCFAECLRALETLHSHSWKSPVAEQGRLPFDVILMINREALRGCHAMINCTTCSNKNGRPVSTMLLGTVFGKVVSLYRAAVYNRMQPQKDAPLAFGAYKALDEDRYLLETDIMLFELRKAQRIFGQYQYRCREVTPENEMLGVYEPQAQYLATQLGLIVDFLEREKI